jgi:hypothetical protein
MEPRGATGGNRSQIESAPKAQTQAKAVAVGCDRLPFGATLLCCQGECWELA